MVPAYDTFLDEALDIVGPDWISTDPARLAAFGNHELPSAPRPPRAVVWPDSTGAVQELVLSANRHRVPLYTVSAGRNLGLGQFAAPRAGAVLVHLGRMADIVEYDSELGYVAIEPGVTYAQLADFLARAGNTHMIDPTTGPPDGSVLANVLEKGGGATMAGDHVAHCCGLEVVLGDGRILRTGDGALPSARTWHLSKLGFGPVLDGLFLQSNLGIVTRMGLWLAQRPEVVHCEFLSFAEDDSLGPILDAARPILADGRVPSTFKATSGLYALAPHASFPTAQADPQQSLPEELRRKLQEEFGVGAWLVSFALYGRDRAELVCRADGIVDDLLARSGPARRADPGSIRDNPILRTQVEVYSGRPTAGELGIVNWRGGGGLISLTPSVPMSSARANELQRLSRDILARGGLEFMAAYACSPRLARALHSIVFDRANPDECRRARACAEQVADQYAARGWPIARAPVDMQEREMSRRPDFRVACLDIRRAWDPAGVLSPGRYGLAFTPEESAGPPDQRMGASVEPAH